MKSPATKTERWVDLRPMEVSRWLSAAELLPRPPLCPHELDRLERCLQSSDPRNRTLLVNSSFRQQIKVTERPHVDYYVEAPSTFNELPPQRLFGTPV